MDNQSRSVATRLALAAVMLVAALATRAFSAEPDETEPVPTSNAAAELEVPLGAPFTDNAVLQRRMPLPVWGWSAPGTTVTVTFAGQTKTATAGESGKWVLTLDPMEASFEPREMKITTSAGKERTIGNILVGEVWMASGQSNMQWKAEKSSSAKLVIKPRDGVEPIREFEVTSVYAQLHPIERATGSWKNGAYMTHSAVGLAFANTLYQQLDVPIGILNCSFSQTAIQAWVPAVGFRDGQDDYTKAIYKRVLEADPRTPEHKSAWEAYYQQVEDTLNDNAARVAKGEWAQAIPTRVPGTFNGNRDATWMFNGRLSPVVPYAVRGAIWNQGYANMHEGIVYYNNLHSLVRGWRLVWDRPDMPVYFHQFYTPGADNPEPSIGAASDMRMGTWLARDIPNAGMASQIDIGGAIHYRNKTVPGFRLALLALKNQYPETTIRQMTNAPQFGSGVGGKAADLVAEGPMFKSYRVDGNKVIVDFDNAEGGFVVGESGTKAHSKTGPGFAEVTVVPEGESNVKLFWLADADRVWHPATIKIEGSSVIVTSDAVASPRGVSYGTGGIAWQVNLYNTALLPMSPFIYYDQKLVTAENWPDPGLKIAGKTIDPNSYGLVYEWRKMPILSTQFRDNAVLQAGQPITIWGSARNGEGEPAPANSVIQFSFDGIETTIPLDAPGPNLFQLPPEDTRNGDVGLEWRVTVPAMEASDQPRTIIVRLIVDGKIVHERVAKNVVVGDVWYVATPGLNLPKPKETPAADAPVGPVRVMARAAKRSSHDRPSRYSIAVSQAPDNRFASEWKNADNGFAAMLGQEIHARTGKPVGIVYMESVSDKGTVHPLLKEWIPYPSLKNAPSLMDDYRAMASLAPGNEFYDANARRYVEAWKDYWNKYIPTMIATKAVPDGGTWGTYPTLGGEIKTEATQTYNVLVHSFTPAGLKGVLFIASPEMVKADEGGTFGEQMSALANGWRTRFGSPDAKFIYTLPDASLAPKVTAAGAIGGPSKALPIDAWPNADKTGEQVKTLVDQIVSEAYPK